MALATEALATGVGCHVIMGKTGNTVQLTAIIARPATKMQGRCEVWHSEFCMPVSDKAPYCENRAVIFGA